MNLKIGESVKREIPGILPALRHLAEKGINIKARKVKKYTSGKIQKKMGKMDLIIEYKQPNYRIMREITAIVVIDVTFNDPLCDLGEEYWNMYFEKYEPVRCPECDELSISNLNIAKIPGTNHVNWENPYIICIECAILKKRGE